MASNSLEKTYHRLDLPLLLVLLPLAPNLMDGASTTTVSPSPAKKTAMIVMKDLRDLARAAEDCFNDLADYSPKIDGSGDDDDDDKGSSLQASNSDDSNKDIRLIFRSWVNCSTATGNDQKRWGSWRHRQK